MNDANPPSGTDLEKHDAEEVDRAMECIQSGDLDTAERLLRAVTARTPSRYENQFERDGELCIKFWAVENFIHYVTLMKQRGTERGVTWLPNAYPRAHYYLGFLKVKRGRPAEAIPFLDEGMRLEPGQPIFRLEKAKALALTGQPEAAIELYEEVIAMGEEVPAPLRAMGYRGKGFQMIELNRLDEAEALFQESLTWDPQSPVARNELAYISSLRSGAPRAPKETVATGGEKHLKCTQCGTTMNDGGRVFNVEGRVIYLCKGCFGKLTKKWWQFWK